MSNGSCDYSERVVDIFPHQIQSKYCGGNIYVSIEGIALDQCCSPKQMETETIPQVSTHHAIFHSFLPDYSKQYSDKTIARGNSWDWTHD